MNGRACPLHRRILQLSNTDTSPGCPSHRRSTVSGNRGACLSGHTPAAPLLDKPEQASPSAQSLTLRLPRLSMITGLFALTWLIVVILMIVRPGSTTGA
ncbi:hypothetical protein ACFY1U_34025 [Streptomyces sp. NPDC001351]|uniref:hypothetical protein n=1 Tax=Streptomyces sp. NPDC001351 TaxID=3364564 RepID=UPI0036754C73